MALIDDDRVEMNREWIRQKLEAERTSAIEKYGEVVGSLFFNYRHSTSEEHRQLFVETVVSILEGDNHSQKVQAMDALLGVFDSKIQDLNKRLHSQEIHHASF